MNYLQCVVQLKNNENGFSLISVLLALVVLSVFIAPYFTSLGIERQRDIRAQSVDEVETVYNALIQFARENQRYPRPADPSQAIASATFGTEIVAGPYNVAVAPFDTMVLGGLVSSDGAPQRVLIGAVPISDLGLPPHLGLDQYGNKLTYAVTEALAQPSGLVPNDRRGAISLQNQYPALGALPPNGSTHLRVPVGVGVPLAQFAVVGHGENGVGAYNGNGARPTACAGIGMEIENCDGDNVFIAMEDTGNNIPIVGGALDDRFLEVQDVVSLAGDIATNAAYFDDFVRVETSIFSDRSWGFIGNPNVAAVDALGAPTNTTLIMGAGVGVAANGRVGVGVTGVPRGLLDVNGNVVASDGVRAQKLCNEAGSDACYNVTDIADDSAIPPVFCGAQIGMVGIVGVAQDNARVSGQANDICNTFVAMPGDFEDVSGPSTSNECPSDQYVAGIEIVGVGSSAVMEFICE